MIQIYVTEVMYGINLNNTFSQGQADVTVLREIIHLAKGSMAIFEPCDEWLTLHLFINCNVHLYYKSATV